jgi:hypothetical protein
VILRRTRVRAATLLVGLLLPAGVPSLLGVHVCPNHGHAPEAATATAPSNDHGAAPGAHGHHNGAAAPTGVAAADAGEESPRGTSCDGLCELLCLGGALLADPRVFTAASITEIRAPDVVVALRAADATPRVAALVPFALPPSHAPPSA